LLPRREAHLSLFCKQPLEGKQHLDEQCRFALRRTARSTLRRPPKLHNNPATLKVIAADFETSHAIPGSHHACAAQLLPNGSM
jgi:hypothetical protein